MIVTGNEAAALGAIAAGLQFAAIYPMSPISNILHVLAKHQLHESFYLLSLYIERNDTSKLCIKIENYETGYVTTNRLNLLDNDEEEKYLRPGVGDIPQFMEE